MDIDFDPTPIEVCTEPECDGTVVFVITEGEEPDAGYECWKCGAKYMRLSEKGPYDAMLDPSTLMEEEL